MIKRALAASKKAQEAFRLLYERLEKEEVKGDERKGSNKRVN